MIGVILWCDPTDKKAVIWCEDQGDLVFLSRRNAMHLPDRFIEIGDVVEFNVETNNNLRTAHDIILVESAGGMDLPKSLREIATADTLKGSSGGSAEVIPFCVDARRSTIPPSHSKQILQA